MNNGFVAGLISGAVLISAIWLYILDIVADGINDAWKQELVDKGLASYSVTKDGQVNWNYNEINVK